MSAAAILIVLAAIAVVAFIAWLWLSPPDQKSLDLQHRSAMPYDSMYVSLPRCTGNCHQGRAPCDCELSGDIAPDFYRVIKAPPPEPQPNHRARAARWALAVAVALYLGLAALLRIEAPPFIH